MGTPPIPLIPTLYNTGVDDNHDSLTACQLDPHYNLEAQWLMRNPTALGDWIANRTTPTPANWITPSCTGEVSIGERTLGYKFLMPAGVRLITLYGSFSSDNYLSKLIVNGKDLGGQNGWYTTTYQLTLSETDVPRLFSPGWNFMTFTIQNIDNPSPTGFLLQWYDAVIYTTGYGAGPNNSACS